jgi:hypothetical protein
MKNRVCRDRDYPRHKFPEDSGIPISRDELPPRPVHLLSPQGRLSVPRVRAFMDFAVPRQRRRFALLAQETAARSSSVRS